MYIRQAEIAAGVAVGEAEVVDAEKVEDGGMEIVHVDFVLHGVVAELVGLAPGETLTATGEITTTDFVILGSAETDAEAPALDDVLSKPRAILPPAPAEELSALVDHILDELNAIAPVLINSRFGRALLNVNTYLSGPTGPVRFALHLRHGDHAATIGFDVNTSAFTRIQGDLRGT